MMNIFAGLLSVHARCAVKLMKEFRCQWAFPDCDEVVCLFCAQQRMQQSVT